MDKKSILPALKQRPQLPLKLHHVFLARTVALLLGIESGATRLVDHPDARLAITERHLTAQRNLPDGDPQAWPHPP